MIPTRSVLAWIVLPGFLLAQGCTLPPPVYVVQGPPEGVTVPGPPPRPLLNIPPAPPDEGYVWQEGYYYWDDGQYRWVEGQWVPGREGYVWITATYVYMGDAWIYRPPYWRPAHWHDSGAEGGHHHGHSTSAAGASGAQGPAAAGGEPIGQNTRVSAPESGISQYSHVKAPESGGAVTPPPPTARADDPAADEPGAPVRPGRASVDAEGWGPGMLPAYDEERGRRRAEPLTEEERSREAALERQRQQDLRRRPDYRGEQEGRMVFTDDHSAGDEGYVTDSTGAIILTDDRARIRRSRQVKQRAEQERARASDHDGEARAEPPHERRGNEWRRAPEARGEPARPDLLQPGHPRPGRMEPPAQPPRPRYQPPEPRPGRPEPPGPMSRPEPRRHEPGPPPAPHMQRPPAPREERREAREPDKRRDRREPAPSPAPARKEERGGRR